MGQLKRVDLLVVHCSATPAHMDVGVKEIDRWHRQKQYWGIGYHFVIRRDGTVEPGRPEDTIGAHVQGYNAHSLGICLVGGVDKKGKAENNFTEEQFSSLRELLNELLERYPDADICGHRDLPGVKKDCPSFDVKRWWNN